MKLSTWFYSLISFLVVAGLCYAAAFLSVRIVEKTSKDQVRRIWIDNDVSWAEVEADGLQLFVFGDAPDEGERFRAITLAGKIVDAARIIDQINVVRLERKDQADISLELLKRDNKVSIYGVLPKDDDKTVFEQNLRTELGDDVQLRSLLENVDQPAPKDWSSLLRLAVFSLEQLRYAKISLTEQDMHIDGMVADHVQKQSLIRTITSKASKDIALSFELTVPRPVIAPFTFRAVREEGRTRISACSMESETEIVALREKTSALDIKIDVPCQLGLGAPDADWLKAIFHSLDALDELTAGTVTLLDRDIKLQTEAEIEEDRFAAITADLERQVPALYALESYRPNPITASVDGKDDEFVVTKSPEGLVQLRGLIRSAANKEILNSLASARFGSEQLYISLEEKSGLPSSWDTKSMTAVEVLSLLKNGVVRVNRDVIDISGITDETSTQSNVTSLLAQKLSEEDIYQIDLAYVAPRQITVTKLDGVACDTQIKERMEKGNIKFESGSDRVDGDGLKRLDEIAKILKTCGDVSFEIAGHTDSQGREEMNKNLSQSRANAVLRELQRRRVSTARFVAKGYGETMPIADNQTAEGREFNRRIEFRLIGENETRSSGSAVSEAGLANE